MTVYRATLEPMNNGAPTAAIDPRLLSRHNNGWCTDVRSIYIYIRVSYAALLYAVVHERRWFFTAVMII